MTSLGGPVRGYSSLFCRVCGSILSEISHAGPVRCPCPRCPYSAQPEEADHAHRYTIAFNPLEVAAPEAGHGAKTEAGAPAEGPTVERRCPSCGNESMSYATLQLRSADEGQTVFYTCTRCQFKESENS